MLPVTYLGLPLITKRLSKGACSTLVERNTVRANSWVSKALSFAGRLQLVKATLISMQCYWCNTFLLPMSTIKECERVLRTFLWGGRGRGKVKWADVCKPFLEGGLGIRDLKTWNKSLLLKHLWSVLTEDSIWAKWCHAYLLHNSNLWTATSHGHLSWSWRQILRLRPLAKEHLIYKCGNGEHFSLWFDPWLHGDSVHALYGHRVIFEAGLSKHARVKDVIREGEWCWPQASCDAVELQQRVRSIPISTAPDSIHWDKVGEVFSTASAFHGIRQRSLSVDWHDIVWHSRRIPNHAFSLWLALRGAHRTKDKLLAVGVVHSADCAFLCGETETLQHLFFQCPFSAMVWREVLLMCNIVRPLLPWADEVLWMSTHARGSAFHHTVRRLAFAATVYHLWIERNRRCFKNVFLPYQEIIRLVKQDVSGKLASGNSYPRCERYHSLCINWGAPFGEDI
ncbi:zf-RVT domain-containing protein [Cephalotus follicularis]|uniref:Zf-RVT domain-containing protein n=1 Tax=Cephalotus follicularis TaxID=3775 RepID=A0A1Q3BMM4_CEPFO|nr:zf-RVT domain-containing protein [Cephalotus follicularis]